MLLAQRLGLVALLGALHAGGHLVALPRARVHPRLHLAYRLDRTRLGRVRQLLALLQLHRCLDGARHHLLLLLAEHSELAALCLERLGGLILQRLLLIRHRLQRRHRLLQRLDLAQHELVLGLLLVELLEAVGEPGHPLLELVVERRHVLVVLLGKLGRLAPHRLVLLLELVLEELVEQLRPLLERGVELLLLPLRQLAAP
mmetsp:Transcript_20200/g.47802  ORF Transcript_20200/g.47802 Transcript_20200/m.47802 type:complete len:201 (-) Transcript_20200:53-655(-)